MRIDDLREVLNDRADGLDGAPAPDRVGAVRGRVRTARRRRTAAGAALAVAAVGLSAVGWGVLTPDAAPDPAPATPDSIVYPDEYAGQVLLGSGEGALGATELTYDITTPQGPIFLTEDCGTSTSKLWLNVAIGGQGRVSGQCSSEAGGDPLANGSTFDQGARYFERLSGGSDTLPVRMWLSRKVNGDPVAAGEAPGARLSSAVYDLPTPVDTMAGHDLTQELYYDGKTWVLSSWSQSEPGQHRRSAWVKGPGTYVAVVAVSKAKDGLSSVRADGQSFGAQMAGDGWSTTSDLDAAGEKHEVQVTVRHGGDRTVIGVAFYELED